MTTRSLCFPDLVARGDLEVPVVVVAGRRDDVARIYSYLEGLTLVEKSRTLATWFDGSFMVVIAGDSSLSRNFLIQLRRYLNDYLYRKSIIDEVRK